MNTMGTQYREMIVAMPSLADALAAGPLVLDGGLSTELEARGHDVSSSLWSARLLRDDPGAIVAAHAAFAAAGAQVATTASYQASLEGFVALGVGPYGAMLADGSEYTGAYVAGMTIADLRAFHRPRMELLAGAGADVLACETVPAAAEAGALVAEAVYLGMPIWLSLTTVLDADGVPRTRRGEPAADVYALVADVPEVVAVGVNCTAPAAIGPTVAAAAVAGKPIVVYPNSGESWDAVGRRWTGSRGISADDVPSWVDAGARLIGGCCRVRPADIERIAAAVRPS
jgi:homocysteine S-methyltransferase